MTFSFDGSCRRGRSPSQGATRMASHHATGFQRDTSAPLDLKSTATAASAGCADRRAGGRQSTPGSTVRETIKVILTYWVRRLAEEPSQTTLRITGAGERFYCLDRCQAWFLQDVASAAGDAELLRLAGTIERLLRERELAHDVDGERAIANEEQRLAY